jgi:hypothetical protein
VKDLVITNEKVWYRIGQLLGKDFGEADLVNPDHRVGRYDGASRVVDSLPHHVHPEDALLPLNQLLEAPAHLLIPSCSTILFVLGGLGYFF